MCHPHTSSKPPNAADTTFISQQSEKENPDIAHPTRSGESAVLHAARMDEAIAGLHGNDIYRRFVQPAIRKAARKSALRRQQAIDGDVGTVSMAIDALPL